VAGWQVGLVVVIAVGVAVILFGALWDRERARRDAEQLANPPARIIPGYAGAEPPAYVTAPRPRETLSLALTEAHRAELAALLETTTPFPAGMAAPEFVSDPPTGWAILERPAVLVCAERVETLHELLQPLERMIADGRGLVVVAPDLAGTVRETLVVNHLHRSMRLLAVRAEGGVLADLAEACAAHSLSRSDLQAGWVPDQALGTAQVWVSDRTHSWVITASLSSKG
jgi:hypothetical protein